MELTARHLCYRMELTARHLCQIMELTARHHQSMVVKMQQKVNGLYSQRSPRSLISPFVIRFSESIIYKLASDEISIF